ncbi:unnamed protein product [Effrenium voratum]|nr:unnamed protein product [Effrenium voratum]
MTVYRMQSRRALFVYAPVAPTDECIRLLRELEEQYGEVAYIVLPTVAVEHKYFVGPFSQRFPKAQVWVCPGQFSVPLQLPLQLLGFPWGERLRSLGADRRCGTTRWEQREGGEDEELGVRKGPVFRGWTFGWELRKGQNHSLTLLYRRCGVEGVRRRGL